MIFSYTQRRKRAVFYLYDKIWLHYFYLTRKLEFWVLVLVCVVSALVI